MKEFLLVIVFFTSLTVFSQHKSKVELSVFTFSGTAILKQEGEVDKNSFIREGGNVEVNFSWDNLGAYIGLGTYKLSTNRVFDGEETFLENQYLFIPFGISYEIPVLKVDNFTKFGIQANLGGYAGNLFKGKEETKDMHISEDNIGWNIGFMGKLGIKYNIYKNFNVKLGIQTMTDISKIENQQVNHQSTYFAGLGYQF